MNNQNFQQFYNMQAPAAPTPEQLAAFQKQQKMFLQQQQQYFMQQQQLQKQLMREEQRNRLRNMNVKSMGVPTFQQHTTMQQQPSNFPATNPYPPNFQNYSQPSSSFSNVQNFPQPSFQPYQPVAGTQPQMTPVTSNMGQGQNSLSAVSVHGLVNTELSDVNSSAVFITSNSLNDSAISNKTDDIYGDFTNPVSLHSSNSTLHNEDNSLATFNRSDSDDFGEFASTNRSLTPTVPNSTSINHQDLFEQDSLLSVSSSNMPWGENTSSTTAISHVVESSSSVANTTSSHPFQPVSSSSSLFQVLENSSVSKPDFVQLDTDKLTGLERQDNNYHSTTAVAHLDLYDDFDDFQTANPAHSSTDSKSLSSSCSQSDIASLKIQQEYVPGTLANDDADVIHSVAIFSNPIKVENTSNTRVSEFDKLIEKSLSGKSSKSDVKSLFKPSQKPVMPSVKSEVKPSVKAANWSALDLGNVFHTPAQDDDDFGDFSSIAQNIQSKDVNDHSNSLLLQNSQSSVPVSDDLLSLFSSSTNSKPSSNTDQLLDISTNTGSTISSNTKINDLFGFGVTKSSTSSKETNSIIDLLGDTSVSKRDAKMSESSDSGWSNFASTPLSNAQVKSEVPVFKPLPTKSFSSNFDMEKIPSLYKDVIDFCNTPSGIIDVGKVYDVLLTEKFKVVALQPLMGQCNMMENPRAKDLVDLIGIVAMKQKGFPTPSKYELNYQKLLIPSVNISALKKNKRERAPGVEYNQPTLLSFVKSGSVKKKPSLAPVFDFGLSSTKDLSSAPFADDSFKNNDSLFSPDKITNSDEDDWGDFGSVDCPSQSSKDSWFDTQFGDFNIKPKTTPIIHLLQEPTVKTSSLTVSLPKPQSSKRLAPPPVLDEPPPLSDNDDEDWADFAHPAHKWDIDCDEIEELAVNNAVTKNRWGTVAGSQKSSVADDLPDKDYSHVSVELAESKPQQSNFFSANFNAASSLPKLETSIFDNNSSSQAPPSNTFSADFDKLSETHEQSIHRKSSPNCKDELHTEKEVVSVGQQDLDRLASMEREKEPNQLNDFVSPFDDFTGGSRKAKTNSDDFSDLFVGSEQTSSSEQDQNDKPKTDKKDQAFISPFADFDDDTEKPSDEFDDFSEFCGTSENEEATKGSIAESLKMKNLPTKDLDGFWNDMVDALGPKVKSVQAFDFEEPVKSTGAGVENFHFVPVVPQPVSYDALKGESFDNEEDRMGAWSKCLSMILTILIQCQNIFGSSGSSSVKQEVVDSEKGKTYLNCCTEVFRVACRISISGAADDGVVEIFKEIKHTWTLISEMLDENIDLPTIRDFHIHAGITFCRRNCGICLLDTGVEGKSRKLQYNGVFYHVTCANFWVNCVNPLLPDLNSKLEAPLL